MAAEFQVDLTGLSVLITGGTRGIGRALVDGFAAAGAAVTIGARHGEECAAVAQAVADSGGHAVGVPLQLSDLESVGQIVDTAVGTFGRLDVVINNAATGLALDIGAFTESAWDKSFAVNLRGPMFLIERALPHLRASDWPSVINVISPGAFIAAPGWSVYAAAKAALLSFTRSYAAALGSEGIRVNAICPGPIATDMFASNSPEAQERIAAGTALRRAGSPEELVGPALFLASRASSYVTGDVLYVNGGSSGI